MRTIFVSVLCGAILLGGVPALARAADGPPLAGATTVAPPPDRPHAYTPAPMPDVGGPAVRPADRAGNATDAGPINATPSSAGPSGTLVPGSQGGGARQSDPTANPVPNGSTLR